MQTECSAKASEFARVEGRPVIAEFDGGALTSDARGLLLGATDKALGLVDRLSGCFRDARHPELIEHTVATLVGQRVFGIALGDARSQRSRRASPRSSDGGIGGQARGAARGLRPGSGQIDAQSALTFGRRADEISQNCA